ncbi:MULTISPECIES: nucleotidyltransferase family protein [Aminobacterium]|jgi:predicted nucleotidyltransferase|uniref:tRNA(Met) cytidine acetate ligase n=1 Tax=Aminobacterium TaxID=81466 RepID=UPI000464C293|nr:MULTISPECIES: nucleotidyltransferase family protein [Aminobacterium]
MNPKIVGIIAEYNPFHNGHFYHLKEAVKRTEASGVVVVLSSHFTQRGEPAFIDKWQRAASALEAGADVVIELPVFFSCHNAGIFAAGAVDILAACKCVTHLAFGMENSNCHISTILDILIHEPEPFKRELRNLMDEGYSYVQARAMALDSIVAGGGQFISLPNNSLALAYLRRIKTQKYPLYPLAIERVGYGYHDPHSGTWASATAIRKAYWSGNYKQGEKGIPEFSRKIINTSLKSGRCLLSFENLWRFLQVSLIRSTPKEIAKYAEMREGLENLFYKLAFTSSSWDDFFSRATSRRYTRSTLQRLAIHFLLGLTHWENRAFQRLGPQYIRILGFSDRGQDILREIKKHGSIPLITRGHMPSSKGPAAQLLQIENKASILWENLVPNSIVNHEIKATPLRF